MECGAVGRCGRGCHVRAQSRWARTENGEIDACGGDSMFSMSAVDAGYVMLVSMSQRHCDIWISLTPVFRDAVV